MLQLFSWLPPFSASVLPFSASLRLFSASAGSSLQLSSASAEPLPPSFQPFFQLGLWLLHVAWLYRLEHELALVDVLHLPWSREVLRLLAVLQALCLRLLGVTVVQLGPFLLRLLEVAVEDHDAGSLWCTDRLQVFLQLQGVVLSVVQEELLVSQIY